MKFKTVGVLGLGLFGRAIAIEMSKYGCDVIAIDKDPENVQRVGDEVMSAAIGDFTDQEFLMDIGIGHCDAVVIATGTNLESSVLAVLHCKKLGVKHIIAKARSTNYEEVLYQVGVDTVVTPELDSGLQLASRLLRNHIEEVLRLDDETSVIEFEAPEKWVGKTILDLDLRRRYDINLIGTRAEKGQKLNPNLDINNPITSKTLFVAIANSHIFERYDYLNKLV
ncbi:potassium channel family protein [Fundicoccus sp. Sow4_H7]|uniref:potassium channel family protein n=1 Tax=Fundicoccus sp. Sow4_H7 TaxID=3438784 RepID=UPI003F90B787